MGRLQGALCPQEHSCGPSTPLDSNKKTPNLGLGTQDDTPVGVGTTFRLESVPHSALVGTTFRFVGTTFRFVGTTFHPHQKNPLPTRT